MSDVNVSIGVSLRELQQGLNNAGEMVKDFREQASKARSAAMFMADGIKAIGGASQGAASLAGNLLGGFALGGPMGLAIGGMNALIATFKEAREAQARLDEEAKKVLATLRAQNDEGIRQRDNISLQLALLNATTNQQKAELQAAADLAVKQDAVTAAKAEYAKLKANDPALFEVGRKVFLAEQALLEQGRLNEARVTAAKKKDLEDVTKKQKEALTKQESQQRDAFNKLKALNDQQRADTVARIDQEFAEREAAANERVQQITREGDATIAAIRLNQARAKADAALAPDSALSGANVSPAISAELINETEVYVAQLDSLYAQLAQAEKENLHDKKVDLLAKIEALQTQHYERLGALNDRAVADSAAAADKLRAQWVNNLQPIAQGFQSLFDGVLNGTKNMGQLIGNVMKQIISSYVGMMLQMALQKVAAAIVGHAAEKPVKIAEVTSNAGVAGSAAAASVAGVPLIGPALAAAAMAETSAMVMAAMIPLASAAGGYDIPATLNPLTQLHAREMVLPATLADKVRNMTDQPARQTALHLTVNAVDSKSVEQLFYENQGAFIRTLETALRNGRI